MKPYIKNRMWIVAIAIILIFVNKINFYEIIKKIISILYPVIVALLFAWFLIPAKKKLENLVKKSKRKLISKHSELLSAILVYLVFIGIIIFFILYLIPILKDGITNSYDKFSYYYSVIKKYISNDTFTNIITPQVYLSGAKNAVSVVFKVVMSFVVLIYVLMEHRELKTFFTKLTSIILGDDKSERLVYYFSKINTIFIKYFYSKLISSLILGILIITGFIILKISYPIFFGVIVAISNLIPIFGSFISGVPIALTVFAEYGTVKTLIAIGVIIAGQQIENSILTPKIVGNSIGISGFWILFTVILGGGLFGFWGMLVCIPVAATLKTLYIEILKDKIKSL